MAKEKISICIPSYNQEKIIHEAIESALEQKGKGIDVLVIDDKSTDKTVDIVKRYPVRLLVNEHNVGIGYNLKRLMDESRGHYIIYLCGDDKFTDKYVVSDYVKQFQGNPKLGVIGRFYYQYMNGHPGAITTCRDKNILTNSCNPSGMAFKKDTFYACNNRFVECPSMVAQYIQKGYEWTMLEYDTIMARIHPGGNTATKEWYYTQSPTKNWSRLLGKPFMDFPIFIQIKNRAPKKLWEEICISIKMKPLIVLSPRFWFYSLLAVSIPSQILKKLSNFYRHHLTRKFAHIIERPSK